MWRGADDRNYLRAPNGYVELSGGVFYQWGSVAITASGSGGGLVHVSFPTPCPNNVASITATHRNDSGTLPAIYAALTANHSLSGFDAAIDYYDGSARTFPLYWQAVCY
ncbi:gp53-like domain-containing protein [Pseudomonas lopnurensis]|uniref:gp53-like domain-containing protein n=1 Tax=Pseudomonas lopnurensis TaxID=1477517 RepID=UPI00406BC706